MADQKLILALFGDEAAADAAVASLTTWDKLGDDVKLHYTSVMTLDDDGKLKVSKLLRARASGAVAGFGGGLILVVLSGPIGPFLAVPVLGGIIGALYRPGLGFDEPERERIAAELRGGKAAVGVLVKSDDEASAVSARLSELRGVTEIHDVSAEVEAAAEQAAQQASTELSKDDEHGLP